LQVGIQGERQRCAVAAAVGELVGALRVGGQNSAA